MNLKESKMKNTLFFLLIVFVFQYCYPQTKTETGSVATLEGFNNTGWQSLNENVIKLIGDDWMLITAGTITNYNMMTASWGGLGWLWEKPVAFIFVRPQRYTHEFTEKEGYFTLTFYDKSYKNILLKMGSVSGRNYNKMKDSGLTALATTNGSVAFKEARLIIECKKIYATAILEDGFKDKDILKSMYPVNDFHTMYVGEIVNVWMK